MIKERSIWMLVTFILVLIILYMHQCRGGASGQSIIKEIVKRDTVYRTVRDTTIWKVPVVKKEIIHGDNGWRDTGWWEPPYRPLLTDSLIEAWERVNPASILPDYRAIRYYEDTTYWGNGYVITRDSVSRNKIFAHQVETNFQIPTITETITVQQKPRTQLYAGLGMISGRQDFIHAFEGTLSLKNKADQIYSLGALVGTDGQLYWKGSVMFKLSLRKK